MKTKKQTPTSQIPPSSVPPPTAKPRVESENLGGGNKGGGTGVTLNDQVLIKSLEQNWKRALADYQNLVKRVEADKKDFVRFSNMNLLAKLVPVLDILDLAAKHSSDPGIKMAVAQFRDVLSSENVREISPAVGDVFDHELHECLETLASPAPDGDNTIAELITPGYKIDKFIIRPAKVKVFKLALDK